MAFILAQAGTSLYKVDPSTGVGTALTLPTGVTLSSTKKPRFAVLDQWLVMVNSPSSNLAIDPEGNVRVLVPRAPASAPSVAAGAGTGLTGAYRVRISFVVYGTDGSLYMESPLSPISQSVTLANQNLSLTSIQTSGDSISARKIYRTTSGGTQYYTAGQLDGNTLTSIVNSLPDASMTLLPVIPTILQGPPGTINGSYGLKTIISWKNRLWGATQDPAYADTIYYTDDGKVYAWPYTLTAYPTGQYSTGVVGFAPRRDQMGILKQNGLWQISGSSNTNFRVTQLTENKGGCISADTIQTINDSAFWLDHDGVYEWNEGGVRSITDDSVAPWFKSDTYFNRSRFQYAFSKFNKLRNQYEIHLAAAGSSSEDRWIAFNLSNRRWYGPHKTAAFTPNSASNTVDSNGLPISLTGDSTGTIYLANWSTFRDGSASAIDFDCYTPFHHGEAPDIYHTWGDPSFLSRIESTGQLHIYPTIGGLNATEEITGLVHDLTTGREVLDTLGNGNLCRLRLRENTVNQGVTVYGYEIPYFENGRR